MSEKWTEAILGIALVVIIVLATAFVAFWFSPMGCAYRWPGTETYWQPFSCYVVVDGQKVPEGAYRVLP